jgi:HPt (histidine-containing phosphotransfer) domain-containing protein
MNKLNAGDTAMPNNESDAVDLTVLRSFEDPDAEVADDLVVELIDLYLADAPVQLAATQEALVKLDALSIKRAVHILKGSSASLGARALPVLCEELEHMDCSDSFAQAEVLLRQVENEFSRVCEEFVAERKRRSS